MFAREIKYVIAYTVQQCQKCNVLKQRRFIKGDILFDKSKCDSCGGTVIVEKIFGESM